MFQTRKCRDCGKEIKYFDIVKIHSNGIDEYSCADCYFNKMQEKSKEDNHGQINRKR